MRFRRVGPDVLDLPRGSAGSPAASAWGSVRTHDRNRETAMAFAAAWIRDNRQGLGALSTRDLVCRWTGFGGGPVVSRGLEEVLRHGREFERRHGVAERYTVVDALSGRHHAAILFEPGGLGIATDHVARVAVYRIEDGQVASIAVYADAAD